MFKVIPYGSSCVLVQFENKIDKNIHKLVRFLYLGLREEAMKGIVAVTPAYNSLTVHFITDLISVSGIEELIRQIFEKEKEVEIKEYEVVIPVCYDDEFGVDLENVSSHTGLSIEEIIKRHTKPEYLVYMMGFVPGFMYLGGMDNKLSTPRLESPRLKIPRGAVGIADEQTGVYPLETPGGWQLIGATPVELIGGSDPMVEMGDFVRFERISKKEYEKLKSKCLTPKRVVK